MKEAVHNRRKASLFCSKAKQQRDGVGHGGNPREVSLLLGAGRFRLSASHVAITPFLHDSRRACQSRLYVLTLPGMPMTSMRVLTWTMMLPPYNVHATQIELGLFAGQSLHTSGYCLLSHCCYWRAVSFVSITCSHRRKAEDKNQ